MKLRLEGYTLHLGRLRSDGFRNVERIRLSNWRLILPKLRSAKIPGKMVGKRLIIRVDDPQLRLPFSG